MESSRWGSLLVRAAARRLLDPEEGCPLTRKYLIKEVLILQELSREETFELGKAFIGVSAIGAQAITRMPGSEVDLRLLVACRDEALLNYQRIGYLLNPWDSSWEERMKETEKRVYERREAIGETGMTESNIVKLVAEYEKEKQRREEHRSESKRPASS